MNRLRVNKEEGEGARAKAKMDASGLKTLNAITSFHFRSRAPLFRSLQFAQFKHKLHFSLSSPRFSPLCSLHTQTCIYVYLSMLFAFSCLGWMWYELMGVIFLWCCSGKNWGGFFAFASRCRRGGERGVFEKEASSSGFSITSGTTTECCKCFQRHQLLDLYLFPLVYTTPFVNFIFYFWISLGIW